MKSTPPDAAAGAAEREQRPWTTKLADHLRNGTLWERLLIELGPWKSPLKSVGTAHLRRLAEAWLSIEGTELCLDVTVLRRGRLRLYGNGALGRYICCHNFEAAECIFLDRYLRRGDVFVDVGANIGLFTVAAAARVGSTGLVLSFEPGRAARRRLIENIELNNFDNVRICDSALSDVESRSLLSVPSQGLDAYGSLATPITDVASATEEVETRTWDQIRDEALLGRRRPTMMKIDVEGWESRVLRGATVELSRSDAPLLQVEFTESAAISAGSTCSAVYQQLLDLGYTVCRFDAGGLRLEPEELRKSYPYVNLFAVKNVEEANRRLRGGRPRISFGGSREARVFRVVGKVGNNAKAQRFG